MALAENIERAVNRDIELHRLLQDHLLLERHLFDENRYDEITGVVGKRKKIERDIAETNKTIATLMKTATDDVGSIKGPMKHVLSRLVEELNDTIRETMLTVEESGTFLRHMKNETGKDLRLLGRRKTAINSYMQFN